MGSKALEVGLEFFIIVCNYMLLDEWSLKNSMMSER